MVKIQASVTKSSTSSWVTVTRLHLRIILPNIESSGSITRVDTWRNTPGGHESATFVPPLHVSKQCRQGLPRPLCSCMNFNRAWRGARQIGDLLGAYKSRGKEKGDQRKREKQRDRKKEKEKIVFAVFMGLPNASKCNRTESSPYVLFSIQFYSSNLSTRKIHFTRKIFEIPSTIY